MLQKYLKVLGSPLPGVASHDPDLQCDHCKQAQANKGKVSPWKRLFKAAVQWCSEQVPAGYKPCQGLFFVFSELSQGHKRHLFVPLVGIQVKI